MAASQQTGMERWKGRVALVTGATAGIGAEIARHLARAGMQVVGCGRAQERVDVILEDGFDMGLLTVCISWRISFCWVPV